MKNNLITSIIVVILVSYLSSQIVYFGFTSNYSVNHFSKATYEGLFEHGVFGYRILSRYMLLGLDDFLDSHYPDKKPYRQIMFLDRRGNINFYLAFFYLNTFFLILTSIVAVLLLEMKGIFKTTPQESMLILFFIPILVNITQFCIVTYDMLGCFFELLTIYIFLKYLNKNFVLALITICLLVVLATLNRESSALTVSLIIALILFSEGFSDRAIVVIMAVSLSFLITYFALRYFINPDPRLILEPVPDDYRIYSNLGGLFWLLFFYFSIAVSNTVKNRKMIIAYHLISLPYIFVVLTKGAMWEVRLYIPLLLGSIFLAKLDDTFLKFSLPFK